MSYYEIISCRVAIQVCVGYLPNGRKKHWTFSMRGIDPNASQRKPLELSLSQCRSDRLPVRRLAAASIFGVLPYFRLLWFLRKNGSHLLSRSHSQDIQFFLREGRRRSSSRRLPVYKIEGQYRKEGVEGGTGWT